MEGLENIQNDSPVQEAGQKSSIYDNLADRAQRLAEGQQAEPQPETKKEESAPQRIDLSDNAPEFHLAGHADELPPEPKPAPETLDISDAAPAELKTEPVQEKKESDPKAKAAEWFKSQTPEIKAKAFQEIAGNLKKEEVGTESDSKAGEAIDQKKEGLVEKAAAAESGAKALKHLSLNENRVPARAGFGATVESPVPVEKENFPMREEGENFIIEIKEGDTLRERIEKLTGSYRETMELNDTNRKILCILLSTDILSDPVKYEVAN